MRRGEVLVGWLFACLETLEEIAMEGKEEFLKFGGEEFHAIPCINDNDDWVDVLVNWIEE